VVANLHISLPSLIPEYFRGEALSECRLEPVFLGAATSQPFYSE
jgi:hypothetical protein